MVHLMSENVIQDKEFDFFTFLIASARGSLEEGVFTASLRLIDAAGRVPESFLAPIKGCQVLERNAIPDKRRDD